MTLNPGIDLFIMFDNSKRNLFAQNLVIFNVQLTSLISLELFFLKILPPNIKCQLIIFTYTRFIKAIGLHCQLSIT